MNEISQLCALLNFKERELRRLNRMIRFLENYCQNHEPGCYKVDLTAYTAIRTKLMGEISSIMDKMK